jgi:hypothetical protein
MNAFFMQVTVGQSVYLPTGQFRLGALPCFHPVRRTSFGLPALRRIDLSGLAFSFCLPFFIQFAEKEDQQ